MLQCSSLSKVCNEMVLRILACGLDETRIATIVLGGRVVDAGASSSVVPISDSSNSASRSHALRHSLIRLRAHEAAVLCR